MKKTRSKNHKFLNKAASKSIILCSFIRILESLTILLKSLNSLASNFNIDVNKDSNREL